MVDLLSITKELMLDLQANIRAELEAQGHKLSGKLIESVTFTIEQQGTSYVANMYMEGYGLILETGVPANRIPFGRKTGAKISKYIQALIGYFQKRGFGGESKSMAFRTARAQKREGMPTRASYRFSRNGRRTGAIRETLGSAQNRITAKPAGS